MLSSVVATLCAVFGLALVLYVHLVCTNHYMKEMDKVNKQVESIQWPVKADNIRRM